MNRIKIVIPLCLVIILFCTPSKGQAEDGGEVLKEPVRIAMANWCPYSGTCADGNGYVADMLLEIFSRNNIQTEFTIVPWTRGVTETRAGLYDILLNPAKGVAADFYFSEEETGFYTYCYYTKVNDNWNYSNAKSLLTRQTAVLKDAAMKEDKTFIEDPKNSKFFIPIAYSSGYMDQVVRMLFAGRVDTFVNSSNVTRFYLKSHEQWQGRLRNAGCIKKSMVWAGLSPHPDRQTRVKKLGVIIDEGIRTLRKDGTLSKVLATYGLTDWK